VVAIAAGGSHNLALKSDGAVVAWGDNSTGQSTVPGGLNAVVAIAAGGNHSLALKSDGTVVGWGGNSLHQTNVPVGLNGVVAIAAGGDQSLALKSDGTVASWGYLGQSWVPAGLSGVVAIAAGGSHSLALKSDGTVVAWGAGQPGQSGFPNYGQSTVPSGLNRVVAIAAGGGYSLALIAAAPEPFTLGAPQRMPDGSFRWMLFGEAERNYTVQSSTNFTLWSDLQTVALGGSSVQITDTNASAFPRRFYRVRTQ
jgi:alpha-tubulin suppressor-like RCC1 family protein